MSTDALATENALPKSFTNKLKDLRYRILRWFLVDGLKRLFALVLGLIAIDLLIDWSFRMDVAQRAIMLVLMSAATIWVFWRYLLRPLMTPLSDEALCLEVESRNPELAERLITALEFSRIDWNQHPGAARSFVKRSIEGGSSASDSLAMDRVVKRGAFWVNLILATILGGSLLGIGFAIPTNSTLGTWFNRNILLGDAMWPQDFYLDVPGIVDETLTIPRGDDWPLTANIRDGYRSLPEEVRIEIKGGTSLRREVMDRLDEGKRFRYYFARVTEPLEFRLTSGKVTSPWYQIRLVDRPEFENIELTATPPAYTGVATEELPAGSGPYYLLAGSKLTVRGESTKELRSARLVRDEESVPLETDGTQFSGQVAEEFIVDGTYEIAIRDTEKLKLPDEETAQGLSPNNPARFKVRLKEDERPSVNASLSGVGTMIVPGAQLPYQFRVTDDFAITDLSLDWEWRENQGEGEPTTGSLTSDDLGVSLDEQEIANEGVLDLPPLSIPVGSRLNLIFKAKDNDTVSGPKVGESNQLILRVVSEADLRSDLLRREKEQRQIFAEIVDRQDSLLTECQALQAETRALPEFDSSHTSSLVALQKRQKLLISNILPIADRLTNMVEEIRNNRLEDEDGILKERIISRIIQPMILIQEETLPSASFHLDRVRRASDPESRHQGFQDAITFQEQALISMREILVHMVKSEGYQQAVNLLYEIQKDQEELKKQTEAAKQELLDDILTEDPDEPQDP